MKRQRYNYLDYVRFIGILLVVVGHIHFPVSVMNFIYLFHMPLFFSISGYLFRSDKFANYKEFLIHKIRTLLVPYLFFCVVSFLFWYFIGSKYGADAGEAINLKNEFSSILSGHGMLCNAVLWFLPALFVTENLYYLLATLKIKSYWILLVSIIAAITYTQWIAIPIPFCIDIAIVALVFYSFGVVIKQYIFNKLLEINYKIMIHSVLFTGLVIALLGLLCIVGRVDMMSRDYGNIGLYILSGFVGTLAMFSLGVLSDYILGKRHIVTFIATYTIVFYAFHPIVFTLLKGVTVFFIRLPLDVFEGTIFPNIIMTILTFVILYPVTWILSRYTPILIGKK